MNPNVHTQKKPLRLMPEQSASLPDTLHDPAVQIEGNAHRTEKRLCQFETRWSVWTRILRAEGASTVLEVERFVS